MEIGNIIDNKKTFIAGAPRSRSTGQVLLFQPTSDGMTTQPQYYLSGEQFGSGFGYDIAVSDFDSDGYMHRSAFLCPNTAIVHDCHSSGVIRGGADRPGWHPGR